MIFTREALERFQELLEHRLNRLNRQDRHDTLTEDEIQNSLNYALVQEANIAEYEIRMEFEHPCIPGKKLDSYVAPASSHGAAAWEVKYDRRPPSGRNSPRSNKAGALINDVFRLAALNEERELERVLVYVTDQEMADYYKNRENHFGSFFDLPAGESFRFHPSWVESLAESVTKRVEAPKKPCHMTRKYFADLAQDHALRVYAVAPASTE